MKKLDSSWILLLFAILVVVAYYINKDALYIAVCFYKFVAITLFICLIPILVFIYKQQAMWSLMLNTLNNKADIEHTKNKFAHTRFITVPIVLHFFIGLFFLLIIRDTYLSMSFINIMIYHRIFYFIISAVTVRHLNTLDYIDAQKNKE